MPTGPKTLLPTSLHCEACCVFEHHNRCEMTRFTIRVWSRCLWAVEGRRAVHTGGQPHLNSTYHQIPPLITWRSTPPLPPHVSFLSFRTRESRDFKVRRLSFAAAVGDFFLCSQGYFDIMHYRHHLDWDHKQKIDKHASVWAIVCFHPAFTFAIKTFQIHSIRQTEMQMYVYIYLFPCDTVMSISEAERIKTAAINFSFMEVRFRCVFFRKLDMSWVLKNTNLLNKKKNHNYAMQICVCKNNLWLASHIHHGNYKGDTLHNEVIFPCIFYTPTTYMTFHWAPGLTCF